MGLAGAGSVVVVDQADREGEGQAGQGREGLVVRRVAPVVAKAAVPALVVRVRGPHGGHGVMSGVIPFWGLLR